MRVAITGGTGFIGRHVLKILLERNFDVVLLTRNLDRVKFNRHPNLTIYECDIHNSKLVSFEEIDSPDVLLHLAWEGLSDYRSLRHYETDLPAHYNFLKNIISGGLKKLVVTGTCFEYGMKSGQLSEDMETAPDNPYGFSKDCLRKELEFLQAEETFGLTWARLFYLWGEGQPKNSLYPQLCNAINTGMSEFDMSGGEQKRDYLPVEQVAEYLVQLSVDVSPTGVVNICSGNPMTVKELVNNWIKEKKSIIKLNYGKYPYPDYEPMEFWGDVKKITRILKTKNKRSRSDEV
jgi:nucleoside-diphosphate-sugar epimerase